MIYFLLVLVLAEAALMLTLVFNTPLRKLVTAVLDKMKQGKGPVVVKTVAATMIMVLISTIHGLMKVQNQIVEGGLINPTDQVLMATHILEASLMGFLLFMALMIDRLHYYINELHQVRKNLDIVKKQNEIYENIKSKGIKEMTASK